MYGREEAHTVHCVNTNQNGIKEGFLEWEVTLELSSHGTILGFERTMVKLWVSSILVHVRFEICNISRLSEVKDYHQILAFLPDLRFMRNWSSKELKIFEKLISSKNPCKSTKYSLNSVSLSLIKYHWLSFHLSSRNISSTDCPTPMSKRYENWTF